MPDPKSKAVADAMAKKKTVTSDMVTAQTRSYHEELSKPAQNVSSDEHAASLKKKYPLADTSPYVVRGKTRL